MYGLTRASTTLIAAAAAGLLIWLATQIDDKHVGGFWAVYGLIAGAGLLMALSQLLGGWTKWGWPRLSATFLLTAFVPIAIVSLWIILAAEPSSGWFHQHVLSWSNSLHIRGLVDDLKEYVPLFAFGIGLVFGFSFDTTGPRREIAEPAPTSRRRGLFGRRRRTDADGDGTPDADEPVSRDRVVEDDRAPAEEGDRVTTR
jgi:uncharacterized SAM-binding protein YcdF (DUF218 family)